MRNLVLLAGCFCLAGPLLAQMPDPGASQDEEAAREKVLKAADQLDLMEGNAESTRTAVEAMKTDLAQMRDQNTALKLQVSTLQDAVQKLEDARASDQQDRAKERQVILDEVAKLVAAKSGSAPKSTGKKKTPAPEESSLTPPPEVATTGPTKTAESVETQEATATSDPASDPAPAATPPPKPHKAYEHIVAPHETLSMICEAFRDRGVKVTVAQIRQANGLTEKSTLKVGQKLLIPKPGT